MAIFSLLFLFIADKHNFYKNSLNLTNLFMLKRDIIDFNNISFTG
ncbi:hypothetical protein QUY_1674 [Clostridioides difficile P71]|nr:hypothetical protein HMPREF1123_03866 [Clostridioides difficile 050-P50-2011]EQG20988.1 hypothetical protein QIG_1635 [Clostridioides difficile DA00065]EQK24006.1 hypothetical protein QUY_1674 [Clostridioides difficile P71]